MHLFERNRRISIARETHDRTVHACPDARLIRLEHPKVVAQHRQREGPQFGLCSDQFIDAAEATDFRSQRLVIGQVLPAWTGVKRSRERGHEQQHWGRNPQGHFVGDECPHAVAKQNEGTIEYGRRCGRYGIGELMHVVEQWFIDTGRPSGILNAQQFDMIGYAMHPRPVEAG
jgi:hypothetical protein